MTRPYVPQPVLDAAHGRSAARAARDWALADQLRDQIEAAGWRVIDSGVDFRLEPAVPADRVEDGRVLYGHSSAVPSRLDEASSMALTVVLVTTDANVDLVERSVAGLMQHHGSDLEIVVIMEDPALELWASFVSLTPRVELVGTSTQLGAAALLNCGLRRASGAVVAFMDPALVVTGDVVKPMLAALEDPGSAVVGRSGARTEDFRTFDPVGPESDPTVIDGALLAFRREDGRALGPLDEDFTDSYLLDAWWSLVLRDGRDDQLVRQARTIPGLPLLHDDGRLSAGGAVADRRARKRNQYRLLDRFRGRSDLAAPSTSES
ncbi:MAG: glycosyltransferase [Chloroflexota bacterium]